MTLESQETRLRGGECMTTAECNATVPQNIVRIIRKKGLKQKFVAERAGYSEQQFSDMLNGRKLIKPCDLYAIAGAMEANVGELFDDAGLEGREEEVG